MIYVLSAIAAYLALGLFLTRYVTAPKLRMRFGDAVLGACFMPIIMIGLLLFMLYEKMWKRILIALAFDPPEEMRASPKEEPTSEE